MAEHPPQRDASRAVFTTFAYDDGGRTDTAWSICPREGIKPRGRPQPLEFPRRMGSSRKSHAPRSRQRVTTVVEREAGGPAGAASQEKRAAVLSEAAFFSLDDFELGVELGRGAFGSVYLALLKAKLARAR